MHTVTRDCGPFAEPIRLALSSPFGVGQFALPDVLKRAARGLLAVDTVFGGCWPREVFLASDVSMSAWSAARISNSTCACAAPAARSCSRRLMQSRYYARATLRRLPAAQLEQRRLGRAAVRLLPRDSGALAAPGSAGFGDGSAWLHAVHRDGFPGSSR